MEHTLNKEKLEREVIEVAVNQATAFGPSFVVSGGFYECLKVVCTSLEQVSADIDFDREIKIVGDVKENRLSITLTCDEMTLQRGSTSPFFKAVALLDSFSFRGRKGDIVELSLDFKNVWSVA